MAIQSIEIGRTATGYHQITDLSSVVSCPGVGTMILIQAEGQPIRYRLDGQDPTNTVGMYLGAGDMHCYTIGEGRSLKDIKFIQAAGGAILNVTTFR